jgi:hypothetical protein
VHEHSVGAKDFGCSKFLASAKDFGCAKFLPSAKDFEGANVFVPAKVFGCANFFVNISGAYIFVYFSAFLFRMHRKCNWRKYFETFRLRLFCCSDDYVLCVS